MSTLLNILLLLVGFVCLIKGADWFVDGSAALAKNFQVPGVIIGLTIVAMGTSAPELAVSVSAAVKGSNAIALSNVVGSNIFNILVVLGACALIKPVPVDGKIIRRDFPIMVGVAVITLFGVCFTPLFAGTLFSTPLSEENAGNVGRILGIVLLLIFVTYIVILILDAKKNKEESEEEIASMPYWKCALLILVGIGMIVGGGQLVVDNAKEIARTFGMSETLIGLTIIAIGTSLPELVTSIVASKKGENGLAVGNAVGSSIFNNLLILGLSATIHPIGVSMESIVDLSIMLIVFLVAFFMARNKRIDRAEGVIMLLIYVADVVFAAIR